MKCKNKHWCKEPFVLNSTLNLGQPSKVVPIPRLLLQREHLNVSSLVSILIFILFCLSLSVLLYNVRFMSSIGKLQSSVNIFFTMFLKIRGRAILGVRFRNKGLKKYFFVVHSAQMVLHDVSDGALTLTWWYTLCVFVCLLQVRQWKIYQNVSLLMKTGACYSGR